MRFWSCDRCGVTKVVLERFINVEVHSVVHLAGDMNASKESSIDRKGHVDAGKGVSRR